MAENKLQLRHTLGDGALRQVFEMGVEIDVMYEGELHCRAKHVPSGSELSTDAPVDNGGRGEAFSPTDLVATALGACMVTIMGLVADKAGLDISGTKVHVVKEMVSEPMRRIGRLGVIVTFPAGCRLTDQDRRQLEEGASTCPVRQSLDPAVQIDLRFV